MATAYVRNSATVGAVTLGQIERASLLVMEGSPLDLQRAAKTIIDTGPCEAFKFLLSNYKLDVDKHFLLHRALVERREDIAKLLIESGTDVNNYQKEQNFLPKRGEKGCAHYSYYLPLQLSLFCSLDMTRFLLEFGADVNKRNYSGETPLVYACGTSVRADRVTFLLDNGANVQAKDWDEESALHCAARTGKVEIVTLLIDHGADIEVKDAFGCTPLMLACSNSEDIDCCKILLEKGATCYSKTIDEETGLHLAVKSGNYMAVKLLIPYGAQLEARTRYGDTALILACEESVPADCVRILLENGAFPKVKNKGGKTPLNLAKEARNEEKMQMLLQYGATEEDRIDQETTDLMVSCGKLGNVKSVLRLLQNKASPNVKNQSGKTALHIAADASDIEILKALVQYEADVNAMTDSDRTPLMLACANSSVNVKCVKFLLENNALPNVTDIRGDTALHRAALAGDIEKLKILVQYRAAINSNNIDKQTPLMLACVKRSVNVECLKFLLENKALPNVTDIRGETALHRAALTGDTEKLKILVQYGADVDPQSIDKQTPLMLACAPECVKFLLENNALPNVQDIKGSTNLHNAVLSVGTEWRGNMPAWCESSLKIKLLVEHGADLEARTPDGRTPLFIAVQKGNLQLIELLHGLGADACVEDVLGQNAVILAMRTAREHHITCDIKLLQSLIDKGVSVNHRDKNGWSPLMLAAKDRMLEHLNCLIEAGADVDAVGKEETTMKDVTALSILLEDECWDIAGCAGELIRRGAVNSLPARCNDFLHRIISKNRREMIQLISTNGMAPTMWNSVQLRVSRPSGLVSPFTVALSPLYVALRKGKIPVIQYLLGNLMLCPCDIYGQLYFSEWRPKLISMWGRTDVVKVMDEFYSQPKSLFQLSFVTVSHALGGVPGRVDRINSLPLPSKVKDKLLFKSIDVVMDLENP